MAKGVAVMRQQESQPMLRFVRMAFNHFMRFTALSVTLRLTRSRQEA